MQPLACSGIQRPVAMNTVGKSNMALHERISNMPIHTQALFMPYCIQAISGPSHITSLSSPPSLCQKAFSLAGCCSSTTKPRIYRLAISHATKVLA